MLLQGRTVRKADKRGPRGEKHHNMTPKIRTASIEDISIISALNADVQNIHAQALPKIFKPIGPNTFSPSEIAQLLSDSNHSIFIAELDGKAVGYVFVEIMHRAETAIQFAQDMLYIHHISVMPDARKRGVGRALLDASKAFGKIHGIDTIALDTWTFNKEAINFFQYFGLVPYNTKLWNRID